MAIRGPAVPTVVCDRAKLTGLDNPRTAITRPARINSRVFTQCRYQCSCGRKVEVGQSTGRSQRPLLSTVNFLPSTFYSLFIYGARVARGRSSGRSISIAPSGQSTISIPPFCCSRISLRAPSSPCRAFSCGNQLEPKKIGGPTTSP